MKKTKHAASRRRPGISASAVKGPQRPRRKAPSGSAAKPSRPRYAAPEVEGFYSPFGPGFPFSYAEPANDRKPAGSGGKGAGIKEAGAEQGAAAEQAADRGQPGFGGGGDWFSQIGGLDGLLNTMGKVQKMYNIFKQFGPIFKLFGGFGGLGGGFGGLAGGLGGPVKTASVRVHPRKKPVRRGAGPRRRP